MESIVWAVILIIIGIEILAKIFFKIGFPLFKLTVALFCIYTGIQILHKKNPDGTENNTPFKKQIYQTYDTSYKLANSVYKQACSASKKLSHEIQEQILS